MSKISLTVGKNIIDYKVLFAFESNNEKYVVYTDDKNDSDGFSNAYIGRVNDDILEDNIPLEVISIAERLLNKIEKED